MSSLVLWPHFYRKEKWLFQKLLQPIFTEAHGEHLCLQRLLLDKSTRPSVCPHKPAELIQHRSLDSENAFNLNIFTDLCYWHVEAKGGLEHKRPDSCCGDRVHEPPTGCAWQIPASRMWKAWNMTVLEKSMKAWRLKTFLETTEVELLSYANELQVRKKQVFMQNDGGCIKNEGRGNSFSTHT